MSGRHEIEGHPGYLKYDNANRSGDFQVLVDGRFLVAAQGNGVSDDQLRAALDAASTSTAGEHAGCGEGGRACGLRPDARRRPETRSAAGARDGTDGGTQSNRGSGPFVLGQCVAASFRDACADRVEARTWDCDAPAAVYRS